MLRRSGGRQAGEGETEGAREHRGPQGGLHARALGRAMPLDMPHPGTVQVTMGFADPAANQCAVMKAPLRPARAGGLRSP